MRRGEATYRAQHLVSAYPGVYMWLARWRHRGRGEYTVTRDTELVMEGFARSGNTFMWFAFRSAQPHPVRLAHHTHAAAQVITAVRWDIPTLVVVRPPVDAALANMVLHDVSARAALVAWIRFHGRIMTVRHGFVAAEFDEVTQDFGAVVRRVNEAFGTSFGVFDHTDENEAQVFAAISERNRVRWGETMTRHRALILARPTAERHALKARRRAELDADEVAPLRARADALYREVLGRIR